MINQKPKKVDGGKRNVVCNECNQLRPPIYYTWYRKTTEFGADITKWTLNSRVCKNCRRKQSNILTKLRKEVSYPRSKKCDCCGKKSEYKLHLDHSHGKSGKFRGWLCRNCNTGIGMLGDSVVGVRRALKYLQKL